MMQDRYGNLPPRVGELLEELGHRRVALRLSRHTDRLRYWPRDRLSPKMVAELRNHKAEIIEVIRWDEERKRRCEGHVRDELEILEQATERFGKRDDAA